MVNKMIKSEQTDSVLANKKNKLAPLSPKERVG
jgi:hypothetical protein